MQRFGRVALAVGVPPTEALEEPKDRRRGTIQELLGHKDVRTTMIYTHILNKGGHGVRSPFDDL